ncbi:MAG: hypothetical protein ACRDRH_17730 [Pseudonocardia sp.]
MLVIERGRTGLYWKAVNSVAFSQDGLQLATAGDNKTARIWSLSGDE